MACEPCKNFKCKYEHQKLIEKVRELENGKLDCSNCVRVLELQSQYDEAVKTAREFAALIDMYHDECRQSLNIAKEFRDVSEKLCTSNRKLRIALGVVSGMLLISSIVILKLALGW